MWSLRSLSLCFGLLVLSSCSLRTMAVREVSEIISDGLPAFERDDDLILLEDALPANIKLLEAMLESDPENSKVLGLLTQMYASYSFGFVERKLEDPKTEGKSATKARLNRLYERGIGYGERALVSLASRCEQGLKVLAELDNCLKQLSKDDVPAMFWYGFNLGAYINQNFNSMSALAQGPKLEKMMQRIIDLDESFTYGSAHLFLMVYFGARPAMMGGNFEKADQHYNRILEINKDSRFYLADVFYARYVAVQKQDQAKFEALLKAAKDLDISNTANPRLKLYNSLAKNRAELFLKNTEEFF